MKYFETIPLIYYPIKYNDSVDSWFNKDLVEFSTSIDFNIRYTLQNSVVKNPLATYDYVWKDDDRPDTVAYFYYGDFYYDWLVLLSAEIFDWKHELPMNDSLLVKYIEEKYNMSFEEALTTIHHYEDGDGYVIDYDSYMIEPEPKRIVYIYDYEFEQNENKRNIKLVSKNYLTQISNEFETLIKNIRDSRAQLNG